MNMEFVVLWRRISMIVFSLMYAIVTLWVMWGPSSSIHPNIVLVATMSMLIAFIKMPILLAYEHWRTDLSYRWRTLWESMVVLMVPFMLTFLTLLSDLTVTETLAFAIPQVFWNVLEITLLMWLFMSIGPLLRELRVIS